MKTKVFLIKLIGVSAVIVILASVYLTGEKFGRFLAGLQGKPEISATDTAFNIGYSLGYLAIPTVTLLALYTAYRYTQKRNKKHA
ncbi:hypothetical protein [Pontibacter mangrovi]|uniref:Uncharacterized protein n=1 Tax=Pontibacter mangrovi TaxID=2589816 RepID=A0A501W5M9_9BACT|nr:hypothetical protein [Pontibacter mangrovi]TPE42581.1 hypothetical protein FJM65_17350 [Pontibacter mangrovi]